MYVRYYIEKIRILDCFKPLEQVCVEVSLEVCSNIKLINYLV